MKSFQCENPQRNGNQQKKAETRHHLCPENWDAEYREYLTRYAYNRVSDLQLAEDLVQDDFVAAWKNRKTFRGTASEKTWLTTVLRNKIIDYYRARGRRPIYLSMDMGRDSDDNGQNPDWLGTCVASVPSFASDITIRRHEFMGSLQKHLDGLPDNMRNAFWMREVEGHSTDEITSALNVTYSNLSTLISRAKQHLRQCFGCVAGQI